MTPLQKLKWAILLKAYHFAGLEQPEVTPANIDALYDDAMARDLHWDAVNEVRCSGIDTDLPFTGNARLLRNYDGKTVAGKMPDGSWLAWDFWYGGGKHGNEEEIEWIDSARDVICTETPVTTIQRTFSLLATQEG